MTQRPRFRDRRDDERFEEIGYVVVPAAARPSLRALRRLHRRMVGRTPPGFHSTMYSPDEVAKKRVNDELTALLRPLLDQLLVDHRPLLSSFVAKGRGDDRAMPPHQDWSFVDESAHASLNVWVPLVDVDDRNGAMHVLPRAHRLPLTIRGTDTPNPFAAIEDLVSDRMVSLEMSAGDVLVHDHRVIHGSPPNRSRRQRVVAGCAVVDPSARILHFRQNGTRMERYEVEDRFFTDHTYGSAAFPASAGRAVTVELTNPTFQPDDVLPVLDLSDVETSRPDHG